MRNNFNNLLVNKPWGSEYIVCKNNTTATWLLKIKKNDGLYPTLNNYLYIR